MRFDAGRILLLLSAVGLLPIALSYGAFPATTLDYLFDIEVANVNSTHIYRAVMGLYLGNLLFWLAGAWLPKLKPFALVTLALFMLSLATGRLLSIAVDGMPHWLMVVYLSLEVIIGSAALLVLMHEHHTP
ncbi:DUF4345 domain-containing protein [Alcanivorax sp.]|uniref:DUF4345 domain-containing protein n=1 Tax=Alcanivorax sp. TaxID=1872427 RepID=UPI0025B950C1|nr:DUF4345 domain-containing protein [Alcanivorax sp.]